MNRTFSSFAQTEIVMIDSHDDDEIIHFFIYSSVILNRLVFELTWGNVTQARRIFDDIQYSHKHGFYQGFYIEFIFLLCGGKIFFKEIFAFGMFGRAVCKRTIFKALVEYVEAILGITCRWWFFVRWNIWKKFNKDFKKYEKYRAFLQLENFWGWNKNSAKLKFLLLQKTIN